MQALEEIRVLDLSRMVAGGMAGMLLADFGADVVKVEQPGVGDPLRRWTTNGESLWWKVYGRNKRCITLNIRSDEGRELLFEMLPRFDVLMESFVPGTMEKYGLGPEALHAAHRGLVVLRVSGWGRDGPDSQRPGFGTLVEAASGLADMTGEADGPPILPAVPIADMVSGLYAANAIAFALHHRRTHGGDGQVIDVSLFESIFSVLGPLAAEHEVAGTVRRRSGSRSRNSAPRGCYETSDGRFIAVSGSTPKMAEKFLASYAPRELREDARFATNEARVENASELDAVIGKAIRERTLEENMNIIRDNGLTAHPVQNIADIEADAHWRAQQLITDVADGDGSVRMQNIVPDFSATPGEIRWPGAELGAHNEAFYRGELGLSGERLAALRQHGVI